jgi:DNA-binding MarR family transcriptional regulator
MAVIRESMENNNQQVVQKNGAALEAHAETLDTLLFQLSWVSHRRLEQELDAFGLTMPQYIALNCILESEKGCTMSDLAQSSHQLSATMTGIIDRLIDRGLVLRERDPNDRRTLRVELTLAGKDLLEQVRLHKRARLLQFLGTLTEEECGSMIELATCYLDFIKNSFRLA